jgi:hypothetical protein
MIETASLAGSTSDEDDNYGDYAGRAGLYVPGPGVLPAY